ncbi:uncharacterized protein G2W53_010631 [Senna tora]|uniref:F-box associated domain-containing protein n=1 Tax=Senna tora TaxID=362788 RepID=A0A835CEA8_9FABA|nr:uncharacterized protein G2W53_010631 [Senna tora]
MSALIDNTKRIPAHLMSNILSRLPINVIRDARVYLIATEFAYDKISGEFCIALIMSQPKVPGYAVVYAYYCQHGTWQKITNIDIEVHMLRESSTHIKGILFWLSTGFNGKKLITFDISSKECKVHPLKGFEDNDKLDLVCVEDNIGILSWKNSGKQYQEFSIWVNIDQTNTYSKWTQQMRIVNAPREILPYSFK